MDGPKLCRHCGKEKVTRPRGLGWSCYYRPGVKELYPVGSANPRTAKYVGGNYRRGEPADPPQCWACGREAPKRSHNAKVGWAVRKTRVADGSNAVTETYCPECFARWGWPPETVYDSPLTYAHADRKLQTPGRKPWRVPVCTAHFPRD